MKKRIALEDRLVMGGFMAVTVFIYWFGWLHFGD